MMRRFVLAAIAGCACFAVTASAAAQEIQLTGPLAGAPAGRHLRLHREMRFEISPGASFTLLDEYMRTIMVGAKLTFHPTDWLGIGAWGGYGFQYPTGTTDELQEKAVDDRRCSSNPASKACRLTEVNMTRKGPGTGDLADDQMGHLQWAVAPQLTFIPFRGKLALFSSLFLDTDVDLFVGPAFVGLKERADCGPDAGVACADTFKLDSRVAVTGTFGLGLNFYPSKSNATNFIGFGLEWRALPLSWNTSGFDNHGGGPDEDFPDNAVNDADHEFHFNSMLTVFINIQLPPKMRISD